MLPFARMITKGKKKSQPTVLKIGSSDTTVFALMSDGSLYGRGSQEFGQMGINSAATQTQWTKCSSDVADIWVRL